MKSLNTAVIVLMMAVPLAEAGQKKHMVDLADMATIGYDNLEELMDHEHAVTKARIMLAVASNAEAQAKGGANTASRVLEAEKADIRAAEAELKAARKNADSVRIAAAEVLLRDAKHDLKTADILHKLKKQEIKLRELEVRQSKSLIDLRTSQLELAKVGLLKDAKSPVAEKYMIEKYVERVSTRQAEHDKFAKRAAIERKKFDRLGDDYSELAENTPVKQPLTD